MQRVKKTAQNLMTLQDLFLLFVEHQTLIIGLILVAPWLSWLICVMIPGESEEPIILGINLGLALLCLLTELGYLVYATNTGGWTKVVKEADLLLLLAPIYYLGVSLWLSRQRLPLSQLAPVRVVRGFSLIVAAYLLLSWIAAKIKIIIFSYLPFGLFLLFIFALLGLAYWGYLTIFKSNSAKKERFDRRLLNDNIEGELKQMRRNMKGQKDN